MVGNIRSFFFYVNIQTFFFLMVPDRVACVCVGWVAPTCLRWAVQSIRLLIDVCSGAPAGQVAQRKKKGVLMGVKGGVGFAFVARTYYGGR